jgi:hypothetical protein
MAKKTEVKQEPSDLKKASAPKNPEDTGDHIQFENPPQHVPTASGTEKIGLSFYSPGGKKVAGMTQKEKTHGTH